MAISHAQTEQIPQVQTGVNYSGDSGKYDISSKSSNFGKSGDACESGDSDYFLETHLSGVSGEWDESCEFSDSDDSVDPGESCNSGRYGE